MVANYIFWLVVLAPLVALRIFGGRPAFFNLLEYQRAVLYRRGLRVRVVGSGRHLVYTGIQKLMILETRPIQVSFEDQCVSLRDGLSAVYSISGGARVQDAWKAIYSAANYRDIPAYVFLCSARLVLNGCNKIQLRTNTGAIEEEIVRIAKSRLETAGFELLSFRLSQCSVTEQISD
jgi:SPFH domain / Band 7 family